jgi:hypothetical protein
MKAWNRICGLCHKSKPALGSRLRMVNGLRTWVCVTCGEGKK